MSNRKDIFDQFRANEHKLRKRPSSQAWNRLESRLDSGPQKKNNRYTIYRRLAMAAALLFLVSIVAILPSYLEMNSKQQTASNDGFYNLEEISADHNEDIGRPLAINATYEDVSLEEGTREKRLTVATRTSGPLNQSPPSSPKRRSEIIIAETEPISGPELLDAPSEYEPITESPETAVAGADDEIASYEEAEADVGMVTDELRTYDVEGDYTEQKEALAEAEMKKDKREASAKAESRSAPNVAPSAEITQMDAASNVIAYDADYVDPDVQAFQWMIGQWQSNEGIGNSYERWEIEDAFTIKGQGILILNGEETFTEEMQIQKIGDQLYFITAIDDEGQKRFFRLKSFNGDVAVFVDEENAAFPQQIILEKEGDNAFNATFTEEENEDMTPNQQNYLRYRNAVEPDRAVRNLSRVRN